MFCLPEEKYLENKTSKHTNAIFCLPACNLDQGLVTKYFCRISLVMYLVYCNLSIAGPECQARGLV